MPFSPLSPLSLLSHSYLLSTHDLMSLCVSCMCVCVCVSPQSSASIWRVPVPHTPWKPKRIRSASLPSCHLSIPLSPLCVFLYAFSSFLTSSSAEMPGSTHWCVTMTADNQRKMIIHCASLSFFSPLFLFSCSLAPWYISHSLALLVVFITIFVFQILAHLLCETLVGPDPESPSDTFGPNNNNHLHPCSETKGCEDKQETSLVTQPLGLLQPTPSSITLSNKAPARLSLERSFSVEEDQQKCVECTLQPSRVYTITTQHGMLMSTGQGSKESLELDVLKEKSGSSGVGSRGGSIQPSNSPSSASSSPTQYHRASSGRGASSCGSHHHSNHHHSMHHHGNHHHHNVSSMNPPSSSGGCSAASGSSSSNQQPQLTAHSHHASHHHTHHHHHLSQPPLQTSVSAHNIRSWGEGGKGEAECSGLACESCSTAPSRSQGSLDLESASREAGKQHRRLERMWSVDRMTGLERGERVQDTKEGRGSKGTNKWGGRVV